MHSLPNIDGPRVHAGADELERTQLRSDALLRAMGAVKAVEVAMESTDDEQRRRNLGHQLIAAHAHLKRLRDALTHD